MAMTTKYPSPVLGYNNNVRHKGKVFHIQTEDSGVKYGHIITHLFMDGGRILKSVKTSYSEYVGTDRMSDIVREMMKQQHKAMFIALRDGKFDAIIDGAADPSQSTQALSAPPGAAAVSPPAPAAAMGQPSFVPQPSVRSEHLTATAMAAAAEEAPPTIRQAPEELTLDLEAVERAAAVAIQPSAVIPSSDLPPPPANLFREKTTTGKYRVTPSTVSAKASQPNARRASPVPDEAPARAQSPVPTGVERRYAPTRPASIFGQAKVQQGKSIFGEDLISDKSLDEVILSYLAEDLEPEKKKKK
jgi:hypothetical protein